ncbi:hypothetical protein IW261DRAFT_1423188 [Armillaria novae-zelandiae]|uniref:Uncharacterized protein n=1 Tax=Armillaria novae-zelandiae TaxID=153914 RepID=A0AA39U4E9_9AGAR|nr:hypothetical protein IW261DRAFT_1423188 [Armillaria novae-zelandiae]
MPPTPPNPESSLGSPHMDCPASPDVDANDFPKHNNYQQPKISPGLKKYHPHLNGIPCDEHGQYLPPNILPPPPLPQNENLWAPFEDEVQFPIANFLFQKVKMSQGDINHLMELWNLSMLEHEGFGPFQSCDDMYDAIDKIQLGGNVSYVLQIWTSLYQHLIGNTSHTSPDFAKEFEMTPYVHLGPDGKRRWSEFMSRNFAWQHATEIHEADPTTNGAMLVPIILGSDKTTVSVATGNVEYHLAYISIGNILNHCYDYRHSIHYKERNGPKD